MSARASIPRSARDPPLRRPFGRLSSLPHKIVTKEEAMNRVCATAAFAAVLSILMVTLSFGGASCCDPAKAGAIGRPGGVQAASPNPVGAPKSSRAAVPNNPGWQGMAAFMGYGQSEGVPLSNLAPRGSCCTNPNSSCAAGQQPVPGAALGCSGGCCGAKNMGTQPAQAAGRTGLNPIKAVAPAPQSMVPVTEIGLSMTASPVKAESRPKPSGSKVLW